MVTCRCNTKTASVLTVIATGATATAGSHYFIKTIRDDVKNLLTSDRCTDYRCKGPCRSESDEKCNVQR